MTLKTKILFQTGILCLVLSLGACYIFWGSYRIRQQLRLFTPATQALVALVDIDLVLALEQRTLWSALASGGTVPKKTLAGYQQQVGEAFDRLSENERRQLELGVVGEKASLRTVEQLRNLYNLWRDRSRELLVEDGRVARLSEPARILLDEQLFPGLEERMGHAVDEVLDAYLHLEDALGFFPWLQAGSRQRVREVNADLAFVIDGSRVYALLNRQFATLQAYRTNGLKEELGRFRELFMMVEDALGHWHRQAVARLEMNVNDRAVMLDLEKVDAVEESYALLRDLAGDNLLQLPAEEAGDALDKVAHRVEEMLHGTLRPTVMASLKNVVEELRQSDVSRQWGGMLLGILLVLLVVLSIRWVRGTLGSLAVLRFGIETFQSGNLEHQIELSTRDEFGELARSLNDMATKLRYARQDAEEINASLERKVDERTRLLGEANRELKAFNYMASHDLRDPLQAVLGLSQVLLEKARQKGNGEVVPLEHIVRGAERLERTISALLNLSQFGYQPLRYDVVDLHEIAYQVAADLRAEKVSIGLDCVGAELKVPADPDLMRLVFENLLYNAVRYADPGRPLTVTVGSEEREGDRVVFVRDNGRGFDPKNSADPFVPFNRLHAGEEVDGKGIGLAIVQRIIHRHGGEIWVESTPGEGTAFYFTIVDRRRVKRNG